VNVLDLFSGIGGFSLGLERAGMRTVGFCEIDPYCRAVLRKHWPHVPIYEDVRALAGADVGAVDVICGGYPCQPFSFAGKRLGAADDRHLWPEYRRLVEELRPAWVIGENVAGHIHMGLDDVLSDLEALGYAWRPFVIPACAVDAKHRRDRVWIVGHSSSEQRKCSPHGNMDGQILYHAQRTESTDPSNRASAHVADAKRMRELQPQGREQDQRGWVGNSREDVSDSDSARSQGLRNEQKQFGEGAHGGGLFGRGSRWCPEPDVGRVAHGIPRRVDRLRALGNAVVPQIPEIIGSAIMRAEGLA
jgi:DNA (cytosine-5)-methyltransferase 1